MLKTLTRIWNPSVCDQLSEEDSETPDIRLDRELWVVGGLRGGPLDGESRANPAQKLGLKPMT